MRGGGRRGAGHAGQREAEGQRWRDWEPRQPRGTRATSPAPRQPRTAAAATSRGSAPRPVRGGAVRGGAVRAAMPRRPAPRSRSGGPGCAVPGWCGRRERPAFLVEQGVGSLTPGDVPCLVPANRFCQPPWCLRGRKSGGRPRLRPRPQRAEGSEVLALVGCRGACAGSRVLLCNALKVSFSRPFSQVTLKWLFLAVQSRNKSCSNKAADAAG